MSSNNSMSFVDEFEQWLQFELGRTDHHSNQTLMYIDETLAQYRSFKSKQQAFGPFLVRRYFAEKDKPYTPYRGELHDLNTDKSLGQYVTNDIEHFIGNLADRTTVRIIVEVGEKRLDLPRWIWVSSGVYGAEPPQLQEAQS